MTDDANARAHKHKRDALEALFESVQGIRPIDGSRPPYWRVMLEIHEHINRYK